MAQTEGVIKYQLDFQKTGAVNEDINEINTWRSILHGLDLIGQHADRYLGYGFGNISARCEDNPARFIISASQTGHIQLLDATHYTLIEGFDIAGNWLRASGCLPPSSEALSHAMIYQLDPGIAAVLHIHDPILWQIGLEQGYPASSPEVEYGTVAMAQEVERLYRTTRLSEAGVLIMQGHEDGVMVFGESMQQAGFRLIQLWIEAHRVQGSL